MLYVLDSNVLLFQFFERRRLTGRQRQLIEGATAASPLWFSAKPLVSGFRIKAWGPELATAFLTNPTTTSGSASDSMMTSTRAGIAPPVASPRRNDPSIVYDVSCARLTDVRATDRARAPCRSWDRSENCMPAAKNASGNGAKSVPLS